MLPRPRTAVALTLLALSAIGVPAGRTQDPAPKAAAPTLGDLAERLRVLEEANKRLTEQRDREARQEGEDSPDRTAPRVGSYSDSPVPDYSEGVFSPFSAPRYPSPGIGRLQRFPLKASFGPGFLLQSDDDQFSLQIHYESQIENRTWEQGDQVPANGGFFLPRQRFFFDGTITKSIEYEVAINRGLGGINLLNAYLNFHLDDRLEFRIGRFFTPFTYDQFAVSNYWLLTPERSVFTTNLSPNRQFGAMAWGYLLDKRFDYAAGVFNGARNSFEDPDNNRDFVGYVNARPFQGAEHLPLLRFLNVGGSVAFGRQDQSPTPVTFRIGGGSPDANIPGNATVPFLILNPDVNERGDRLLGSAHLAYFYKGLSVIGEWQYGYGHYLRGGLPSSVRVPFNGYYVAAGYFLTGEEVERRTRVKPLRSVFPVGKDEERGLGAWELTGRVAELRVGPEVFTAGLADRTAWSGSARTTEVGLNWYLNEYLKVYAFWLRGEFGDPVRYRTGQAQKTADMFWLRAQLYF